MGNGHPISAVVTTSEIAMKFVEAESLESLEEVNKLGRTELVCCHIAPPENLGMNQGQLYMIVGWVVEGGEGGGEGEGGEGGGEGEQRRALDLEPIAKTHIEVAQSRH